MNVGTWERIQRPQCILAERSVHSQANIHEHYKQVLAQYGNMEISTGTSFVDQFKPWYLGMAHPYTIPVAVGGYDVPYQ